MRSFFCPSGAPLPRLSAKTWQRRIGLRGRTESKRICRAQGRLDRRPHVLSLLSAAYWTSAAVEVHPPKEECGASLVARGVLAGVHAAAPSSSGPAQEAGRLAIGLSTRHSCRCEAPKAKDRATELGRRVTRPHSTRPMGVRRGEVQRGDSVAVCQGANSARPEAARCSVRADGRGGECSWAASRGARQR